MFKKTDYRWMVWNRDVLKTRATLILCWACLSCFSIENDVIVSKGASSIGLGGASVAQVDLWACMNNQGALAFIPQAELGLSYENRYGLKELSVRSLAAAYPRSHGVFSAQVNALGRELFSVYKFGMGYSRKFGDDLGAGMHFDLLSVKMSRHEPPLYVMSFELGMLLRLSEHVSIGMHLFNPAGVSYTVGSYRERLPVSYRLGAVYRMASIVAVNFEVAGSDTDAPMGRLGFNYMFGKALDVSLGFQTLGASLGAGLGYSIQGVKFNLSCKSTQNLGRIYSLSVVYSFK